MWGIFGKPVKGAIWNTPGLLAGLTTCLRFSSIFEMLVLFAASFCSLAAAMSSYKFTPHQQKPVLIRDEKVKWLNFGSTPDP